MAVMGRRLGTVASALALAVAFGAGNAHAQRRVEIVVMEGQALPGGGIVNNLYQLDLGGTSRLSLVGSLDAGGHFLWVDGAVVWRNNDVSPALTLNASNHRTGSTASGAWTYLATAQGLDAIFVSGSQLIRVDDQAPGYPSGAKINFLHRPTMADTGELYFTAAIDLDGDFFSDERVLYRSSDGTLGNVSIVVKTGDTIGPLTFDRQGVGPNYEFSDDGTHYILDVSQGSTDGVLVDGAVVAVEGDVATSEGTWTGFDRYVINNDGHWAVMGDTDGPSLRDRVLAYDGTVVVKEDDSLAGVDILNPATPFDVSLNDLNQMAHVWSHNPSNTRTLFFTCDPTSPTTSSTVALQRGDDVDVDGDGTADGVIDDFNMPTNFPSRLELSDDYGVYINVDLDLGTGDSEAILRVPVSCCGDGSISPGEDCDDSGESATCNADCTTASCGDGKTNATANEECDDAGESAACNVDCTMASCGDGKTNATANEECDGAGESATCNDDCTEAMCGDGKENGTAGEECDIGGGESAACDSDCTLPRCGDGLLNTAYGEVCDTGGNSADCDSDCTPAECGDGLVNSAAGEQCDLGGVAVAGCDAQTCKFTMCGDGSVNATAGEQCDTGGESATCDVDCTMVSCGDGILNTTAGEQCEDGNTADGDGCSSSCRTESGSGGAGGAAGAAGASGSAGTAGMSGGAGTAGSGASAGSGGNGGMAGAAGAAGEGATSSGTSGSDDDGGCGCRSASRAPGGFGWALLAGLLVLGGRRGRSSRSG